MPEIAQFSTNFHFDNIVRS